MGIGRLWAALATDAWAVVGLVGQGVFTSRFLVQWIASERRRETVLPEAFWWLSLAGGLITLPYAVHLGSLAFSLAQGMGLCVYARNLMLVHARKRRNSPRSPRFEATVERRGRAARVRIDEGSESP